MNKTLLRVEELQVQFPTSTGWASAVDRISFSISEGETLGIVGESGSGKSVTGLSLMRLTPTPGKISNGKITFEEQNLHTYSERRLNLLRGGEIAMVFQDPFTSLNPVMTIGKQVAEVITLHQKLKGKAAWNRAVEALKEVRLPSPELLAFRYPHQLSGGQRQRVMLAMAFACRPKLLIADEPTTALDVTLQAQILELMKELQVKYKTAVILISHDVGVIGAVCDRVLVMYGGKIVEQGTAFQTLETPLHPYTQGLLASLPDGKGKLQPIPGQPPKLTSIPKGCPFVPRCKFAMDICSAAMPAHRGKTEEHTAACVLVTSDTN